MGKVNKDQKVWRVEIWQLPAGCSARFCYESRVTGLQIWDEMLWPLSPDAMTERGILSELYDAVLEFWSIRE